MEKAQYSQAGADSTVQTARGKISRRPIKRLGARRLEFPGQTAGKQVGSRYGLRETTPMPFAYTTNLSEVRALAEKQARSAGLPEDRIVDLVIAVAEITANTVRHARSAGSMEIWADGAEVVCEIRDAGLITDPLAGRRPPAADASGGHGLWLVHQVCDRVDLRSDENGTVIRLHMALP
jgi:anti-sigma regulatory factor (Ser/Thr protein kinase)